MYPEGGLHAPYTDFHKKLLSLEFIILNKPPHGFIKESKSKRVQ